MMELGLEKIPVQRGMEGRRLRCHWRDIRGAMVDSVRQHEDRDKGDKEQQRKGAELWLSGTKDGGTPTRRLSSLRPHDFHE